MPDYPLDAEIPEDRMLKDFYKAFEDIGSDLSFSIAMLDENNDGLILTGIFGREESTTYVKPVDKGISRYDLSEEELTVLNEAINKIVE